jgi:hypothetical protein
MYMTKQRPNVRGREAGSLTLPPPFFSWRGLTSLRVGVSRPITTVGGIEKNWAVGAYLGGYYEIRGPSRGRSGSQSKAATEDWRSIHPNCPRTWPYTEGLTGVTYMP